MSLLCGEGSPINAIKIRLDKVSDAMLCCKVLSTVLSYYFTCRLLPSFTLLNFSTLLSTCNFNIQFSTVSKALNISKAARKAGIAVIVGYSESGPETLDPFIADLSVALGVGQLMAGGLLTGNISYG